MKISLNDNRFCLTFTYHPALVTAVKTIPGRKWDADKKIWTVPVSESLFLADFIERMEGVTLDEAAKSALDKNKTQAAELLADSAATDSDIDIPCPAGLDYLPYQRAGINYALKRTSTLIADEMGLGKTIQAIGFANAVESKTVLIVCPASLRLNWLREWEKWDTLGRAATVIENGKQEFPESPVVIINYDLLTKFDLSQVWDLLILDEAHYCKNPKAARTLAVFGGGKKRLPGLRANRKIILTGTPILNKPIEAFPLLKSIDPEKFGNWKFYVERYCDAKQDGYGWDVTGASNLGELQERLRTSCMVRRLKKDVLTELPPKRRQIIEIADKAAGKEQREWAQYQDKIETLTVAAELAKCGTYEEYKNAVEELNEASSAAFGEMSRIRHETAIAKIPHAIDFITDALDSSEKIIVFAHHRDVIAELVKAFPGCVSITGETAMQDRQDAVDKFQNDQKCRVFIGNIKAAGVGLTLTAAAHVIFVELDWVPGNMSQAEDRAHRIGQTGSVLVQHIVLADSLDATIAKRLIQKQEIIDKALDSKTEKDTSIIPVAEFVETPKKEIEEESITITDEESTNYLRGIKILASFCDGARTIDGRGFSKIDVRIGMSLAQFTSLSKKQAVIAKKLCNKYRKQIPGIL